MSRVVYWVVRGVVALLQALPLKMVAWLGRAGGLLWWMVDFKHRDLVFRNLQHAFSREKPNPARQNHTRDLSKDCGKRRGSD